MAEPARWLFAVVALLVLYAGASCSGSSGPDAVLVLAPLGTDPAAEAGELDEASVILQRRAGELLGGEVDLRVDGETIVAELYDLTVEEAEAVLTPRGLLQFCEPVMNEAGDVAVVETGEVRYEPGSCEPERIQGEIAVDGGSVTFVPWEEDFSPASLGNPSPNMIVWQPAGVELEGELAVLDGNALERNTFTMESPIMNVPMVNFEWRLEARDVASEVTTRLAQRNYPLAIFVDGEPLVGEYDMMLAPHVQSTLREGGVISGLERADAEKLSASLNAGALPFALQVVEVR